MSPLTPPSPRNDGRRRPPCSLPYVCDSMSTRNANKQLPALVSRSRLKIPRNPAEYLSSKKMCSFFAIEPQTATSRHRQYSARNSVALNWMRMRCVLILGHWNAFLTNFTATKFRALY
ncbi:hypothetical protein EVAR_55959_1 [Eumeta japonica]|uniref:Uncharacterized protein n=1 Tax=Eumeta variegata TaxID=151549 RepID=A0A4C1YUP5_EUMVA|nr:hypothetical protein EVAR_55959_1 [Eumeta japonica]